MSDQTPKRIVVGLTGATGQLYGIRLLECLQDVDVETHVVVSDSARILLKQELDRSRAEVHGLADVVHSNDNIGASIASGSFRTAGMLVAPCSMKTLANIANGNAGTLITRAADVALKERRPLVLFPREKPLNRIHLENMLAVTEAGAIVNPPFPSFYHHVDSVNDLITRTAVKSLTYLDVHLGLEEWTGLDRTAVSDVGSSDTE